MDKALEKLKDWWFVVVVIASAIASWTTFDNRLSAVESKQEAIVEIQRERDVVYTQLQVDIASIKTALEFIQEKLD